MNRRSRRRRLRSLRHRATSTRTWKTPPGAKVEAKDPKGRRSLRRTAPPPRAWSPASLGPRWPRSPAPAGASSPTRGGGCASGSAPRPLKLAPPIPGIRRTRSCDTATGTCRSRGCPGPRK
ncbi:uncharacterized protein LOC121443750 isoform X4 [Microtus oregoni]|uniref:uncharacterized protein LOC121443750 isoform X4 n=1 Tax=Microtus oregoni TaxID=111838 RepID=UPI001BB24B16|nr:uncharacterized protein LOC121443750 isoform X4 [Microtus oregoni]